VSSSRQSGAIQHKRSKGQRVKEENSNYNSPLAFVQIKNSIKPLIVFAGILFGAVGALASIWIMNMPRGFPAILDTTSLIDVIVSHVIVLFDFIEERRVQGSQLREVLIDAGILCIRPVLNTVGATVLALFPLAPTAVRSGRRSVMRKSAA